jgi:hypothetical protein
MLFLFSYQHAEFIAIDEQPDHDILQQDRFRKTNSLSHEPLQPGPKCQMFPFNLLRMDFPNYMLF